MLELRPSCENCNKRLPADSIEAMICSFECTFCQTCVDEVLQNVCPNCGGGFCKRPIRPRINYRNGNDIENCPASTTVTFKPVNKLQHIEFSKFIKDIPVNKR